jgi:YHS domain-containing protein
VTRVLLVLILLCVLAWAFWRLVDGIIETFGGTTKSRRARNPAVRLVRDPVCGTFVHPAEAVTLASRGATYFFCSAKCRDEFNKK